MMTRFLILLLLLLTTGPLRADDGDKGPALVVFAASSLTDVLAEQAEIWAEREGVARPRLAFGASAAMARQVEAGAPADLFISANEHWVRMLEQKGLLADAPVTLARNRLVLVIPRGSSPASTSPAVLTPALLRGTIGTGRLAIADPALAPAGAYARDYLKRLGLWAELEPRLALAPNVRQALLLAERGGLPAFVYKSDALKSDRVQMVAEVPEGDTSPVLYMAGLVRGAPAPAAAFLRYLGSDAAAPVWIRHGFGTYVPN